MRVSSAGSLADVSPGMSLNQIVALQPVFPFNDVVAANSACSFLGLHGKECVTRLDQSIVPAELRTAPLVVIGGIRNDWAVRLGVNLRYKLAHEPGGGVNFIEDSSNPANHSWAVDMTAPIKHDQVIADYALINRVLDPSTGQWWVGVAGITGLGTLAAEQVLVDPKTMSALSANFPRGWERKNLQIVLEVKILRGIASDYRPVAVYAW